MTQSVGESEVFWHTILTPLTVSPILIFGVLEPSLFDALLGVLGVIGCLVLAADREGVLVLSMILFFTRLIAPPPLRTDISRPALSKSSEQRAENRPQAQNLTKQGLTLKPLEVFVLLPLFDHGCHCVIDCGAISRGGIGLRQFVVEMCNLTMLG